MRRKPIFEYRLNGEECSQKDILDYANSILHNEFDYIGIEFEEITNIKEAINVIRRNDEIVEYLGG